MKNPKAINTKEIQGVQPTSKEIIFQLNERIPITDRD